MGTHKQIKKKASTFYDMLTETGERDRRRA
jgi:hypothetical protein